jgi:hypothetical protein
MAGKTGHRSTLAFESGDSLLDVVDAVPHSEKKNLDPALEQTVDMLLIQIAGVARVTDRFFDDLDLFGRTFQVVPVRLPLLRHFQDSLQVWTNSEPIASHGCMTLCELPLPVL